MSDPSTDAEIHPVTADDLESFAQKLEVWGAGLPPAERAVLRLLLQQTRGAAPEDVAGYAIRGYDFSAPIITQVLTPALQRGVGYSTRTGGLGTHGQDWFNIGYSAAAPGA